MKADIRKKLILENAKRLFSRKGYYHTQVSDIVNEAKIARGTIYQYFRNKDDIFITLLKDFYHAWERNISLEMHKIDLATISPRDYFSFRVKNTLQFLANDPELCNIVLRMGLGLSGNLEAGVRRFEKKIMDLIVSDLELGVRNARVRNDLNIELTAQLITGALLKTAHYFFGGKKIKRAKKK